MNLIVAVALLLLLLLLVLLLLDAAALLRMPLRLWLAVFLSVIFEGREYTISEL